MHYAKFIRSHPSRQRPRRAFRYSCTPPPMPPERQAAVLRYEMLPSHEPEDSHLALAEHYAAYWNDLERCGMEPTEIGLWKAAAELNGGDWIVYHDHRDGNWKVSHADHAHKVVRHGRDAEPLRYAAPPLFVYHCPRCGGLAFQSDPIQGGVFQGYALCSKCGHGFSILGKQPTQSMRYAAHADLLLRYAAKRIPKGYVVHKDGRVFRAGMWVGEEDLAGAVPATGKEHAEGGPTKEADRQAAYHHEKRRSRGPVDRAKLHDEKLSPHTHQVLTDHELRRAKRTYNGLHQHHNDLTAHRLEELVNGAHEALKHVHPEDEITRERLSKRLRGYHEMLHWHDAKMGSKEPWQGGTPVKGKVYNMPTGEIIADPARFQFKLNVNKEGVTDELKSVKKFDPEMAGVVSVWKDPANGKTYVINGHHRLELAKRTGHPNLNVMYIDAPNEKFARARGALVNIAEGRGTAVDAAKFMRDMGKTPADLEKDGISLKGKVAADAVVLTRLNNRLFEMVSVYGTLSVDRAITIASQVHDHYLQDLLVSRIDKEETKGRDISPRLLAEMARKCAEAPKIKAGDRGGGPDLFGGLEDEDSVFVEECDLQAYVRAEMAKDFNDWKAVSSKRRVGKVSADGKNVLDIDENKKNAEEAAIARGTFDRLVNRKGKIADIFHKHAVDFAKAQTREEKDGIRKQCHADVREAVERESGPESLSAVTGGMETGSAGGQGGSGGHPEVQGDAAAANAGGGNAGAYGVDESAKQHDLTPGRMPVSYAQSEAEKSSHVPDWKDPPLEKSPWLSPEDQQIEQDTQKRAREQYPDFKSRYIAQNGTLAEDGSLKSIQLNTDEWRPLFPEYHGTNASVVHEASSYLNKRLLNDAMHEMRGKGNNTLAVLAGGGGSGKGTAVGQFMTLSDYPIVVDQVSDRVEKVDKLLDAAKSAGYASSVVFVDRHPKDAWLGGVVPRAVNARKKGKPARTVPLDVALEANLEARKATIQLLKSGKHPVSVIDNNRGLGKAVFHQDPKAALAYLESQQHDQAKLKEELEHETFRLHESGEIPGDIAEGLIGAKSIAHRRGQPGQPEGSDQPKPAAGSGATGPPAGTPGEGAAHGRPGQGSQPAETIAPAKGSYHEQIANQGKAASPSPDLRGIKGTLLGHLARSGTKGLSIPELQKAMGQEGQHAEEAVKQLEADQRLVRDGDRLKMPVVKRTPKPASYHEQIAKQAGETKKGKPIDEGSVPNISVESVLDHVAGSPKSQVLYNPKTGDQSPDGSYHAQIAKQAAQALAEVPAAAPTDKEDYESKRGDHRKKYEDIKTAHETKKADLIKQKSAALRKKTAAGKREAAAIDEQWKQEEEGHRERMGSLGADALKLSEHPHARAETKAAQERIKAGKPNVTAAAPPAEKGAEPPASPAVEKTPPVEAPKPAESTPKPGSYHEQTVKAKAAMPLSHGAKQAIAKDPAYQAAQKESIEKYVKATPQERERLKANIKKAIDAARARYEAENPYVAPPPPEDEPNDYRPRTMIEANGEGHSRPAEPPAKPAKKPFPKLDHAAEHYKHLIKTAEDASPSDFAIGHAMDVNLGGLQPSELRHVAGLAGVPVKGNTPAEIMDEMTHHVKSRRRKPAVKPEAPPAPGWAGNPELQKKVYGKVTVKPPGENDAHQYGGFVRNLYPFMHNGKEIPAGKGWIQHDEGGLAWGTFTDEQAAAIVARNKAAQTPNYLAQVQAARAAPKAEPMASAAHRTKEPGKYALIVKKKYAMNARGPVRYAAMIESILRYKSVWSPYTGPHGGHGWHELE